MVTNRYWTYRDYGRAMGACREGIRGLMLPCFNEIQAIAARDEADQTPKLARVREHIDELRAASGQARS